VRSIQTFQGKLYVGGYEVITNNIWRARLREWNGSNWRELGDFVDKNAQSSVNAMAVSNSTLYFGGTFFISAFNDFRHIGVFNGSAIDYEYFPSGTSFSRVRDLHFFQGKLCAAGSFSFPAQLGGGGGVACLAGAGAQWQTFPYSSMRALEDDGITLFAGGFLQTTGIRVVAVGQAEIPTSDLSASDYVLTLASQNGKLLIGGQLAQRSTHAQGVLRWNGSQLDAAYSGDTTQLSDAWGELAFYDGKLFGYQYSGATFGRPGQNQSMALREGPNWRYIDIPMPDFSGSSTVFLPLPDKLYLSAQINTGEALYEWQNSTWVQLANGIFANAIYAGSLVSVPQFQSGIGEGTTIKRVNGNTMESWLQIPPLRRNGQDIVNAVLPLTLIEFQGRPVIAGQFDEMVGVGLVGGVATYFDGAWHPLGSSGLLDPKWSQSSFLPIRLQVWNNELYASSGFTQADGQPVDGIARFDGTTWQAVAGGIVQSDNVAARADVRMIVYQGKLYAYGLFDRAGGLVARSVVQWDGSTWRTLRGASGEGFGDGAFGIRAVVANNDLVFTGDIHEAGGEVADYIATWRASDVIFASGFE
jgi:trimeric autotransporter adhesin